MAQTTINSILGVIRVF